MKKSIALILLLLATQLQAQLKLKGSVKNQEGMGLSSVNLSLQQDDQILAYAITNKTGEFNLSYQGKTDSLQLVVSCFNYARQIVAVKSSNEQLHFVLIPDATELKEVVVKAEAIVKKQDTLVFNVASFASKSDRSIGDVIAKLPGVEVENGTIKYQGKPINVYYTQGKNLLGQGYQTANENIGYNYVKNVEILKNHQPIKALSGLEDSEQAAINLDFKESTLNKPISAAEVGTILVSEDFSWKVLLTTFMIGKTKQSMTFYQGNNVGETVREPIVSIASVLGNADGMLSASSVSGMNPSKKAHYFLFNTTNLLTTNQLLPFSKDQDFKINAGYLNDQLSKASGSKTTYYNSDGTSLDVVETHSNQEIKNQLSLVATLVKNLKKDYLNNKISLTGQWKSIDDQIVSNPNVSQHLDKKKLSFGYELDWLHVSDLKRYRIVSKLSYDQLPEQLSVNPSFLLKNQGKLQANLLQEVNTRDIKFTNTTSLTQRTRIGDISLVPTLAMRYKTIASQLYERIDGVKEFLNDNYTNDFKTFAIDADLRASHKYVSSNSRFELNTNVTTQFDYNTAKDPGLLKSEQVSRVYANFSLGSKYSLSRYFDFKTNYNHSNSFNNLEANGFGAMMTNYRTLTSIKADNYLNMKRTSDNFGANIEFNDVEKMLSITANVSYSIMNSNQILSQTVNPDGTINETVFQNNRGDSKRIQSQLNKYYESIHTTFNLTFNLGINSSNRILDGVLKKITNTSASCNGYVNTKPLKWLEARYDFTYTESKLKDQSTTSLFNQNLGVSVSPFPKWSCRYDLESNYLSFNKKRYVFSDLTIRYKHNKKYDFYLMGRNLANVKTISSAQFYNNTLVVSSYELRPINFLLGMKFNL